MKQSSALICAAALAFAAGAASAQTTTLRIQNHSSPESTSGRMIADFVKNVHAMSGGDIQIEMFYSASVVPSAETFDAAANGIVDCAAWLVDVIPSSMGPYMAVITGLLSIPMTFFMSNDAFYFGILPVLTETAAHYGISAADMARASITGQPVHMQSPLVPAILLLVSLAGVDLGDHHKKVLWRALLVSLVMLTVGVLIGVIAIG